MNKRANWVAKAQEFDLEIKPTKLVRGQGLCKLIMENDVIPEGDIPLSLFIGLKDTWFSNVAYYLTYGECPTHFTTKEQRNLKLKEAKYVIVDDILYKRGLDGMFLRCVDEDQQKKLLQSFHSEACGGHFSSTVTAFKILRNCYYWPGMFKDAYKWVAQCEKCKLFFR